MTTDAAPLAIVWDSAYEVDIGPHVFPTRKYRLVYERLVREGVIRERDVLRPTPATDADVGLIHTEAYIRKIIENTLSDRERAVLEVPFSADLRRAMWLCAGGTHLTAEQALSRGVAVHLGGGFHHAFADHGEGFCLVNDVAIAVAMLRKRGTARRACVIDLDVHHGNGTAAIFAADPDTFTFSMHQESNYPAVKPPGDLDVGLADGTGDAEYMAKLESSLDRIAEEPAFDVAFYLAGADPYRRDQLGGLDLTIDGLARRDRTVLARCGSWGLPVAITLAGGYAVDPNDTVEVHCNTVRAAAGAVRM